MARINFLRNTLMKIVYEDIKSDKSVRVLKIESADYLGSYSIKLLFSDEVSRIIDFKPFLTSSSHPAIRKYLDKAVFSKFEIKHGNLNWNDYDLIFPIIDLYEGKI
jgi:hypothetical protein